MQKIAAEVSAIVKGDKFPIAIGGDGMITYGVIKGLIDAGMSGPIHADPQVRAMREGRPVRDIEMGLARPEGITWLSVSAMPMSWACRTRNMSSFVRWSGQAG